MNLECGTLGDSSLRRRTWQVKVGEGVRHCLAFLTDEEVLGRECSLRIGWVV